ncbi:MAG: amidohydrolase family protein [Alphaproteobacteria bacterium]|nr:amidohydrolase family protein [Alphaproteobacteria bacterium]
MYKGEIIDTHMHLWDLKNNYPWLTTNLPTLEYLGGNYNKLKKNFLGNDYSKLIQQQKITKSVHVEAFGFQGNPILETQWLQKQAELSILTSYIVSAIKFFGHDRCMFGSNFSPDSLFYNFNELVDKFKTILNVFTEEEQHKIFYKNAEKIYNL